MKPMRVFMASGLIAGATILALAAPVSAQPPANTSGVIFDDAPIGVDCGTFEVWDRSELHANGKLFFDDEGNVVRVVEHVWGIDTLYNPENGKSVTGSFNNGEIVDLVNGDVTENGSVFRITIPGLGAVFIDVGKFIIDFDDGLVFLAGRHDFFSGDTAGLCAALS
jgi:hypothetical protein